jgi:YesN/AraC family two-component response regulator
MLNVTDKKIEGTVTGCKKIHALPYRPTNKYQKARLSPAAAEDACELLSDLMEKKKIFLDPELTLETLAQKMSIHRNILSQLINGYCGTSFNDYINTYRVREATRILSDSINKKTFLKMWRINADAGFNSKSTFYRVFKRQTGCTPFEYKYQLEKSEPSLVA